MTSLKQGVKQILINKQHKIYGKKLSEKKMSYSEWIEKQERKLKIDDIIVSEREKFLTNDSEIDLNGREKNKNEGFLSENASAYRYFEIFDKKRKKSEISNFLLVSVGEGKKVNLLKIAEICGNNKVDVILFGLSEGEISQIALPLIYQKFAEDENIILIYGDEDIRKTGEREKPWFKPDWSFDTFLSYFYLGSLVAVRADVLQKLFGKEKSENGIKEMDFYELCYLLVEAQGKDDLGGYGRAGVFHIPEIVFHSKTEGYETIKDMKLPERPVPEPDEKPLISIIIPSKDNPQVLFTCIHSLLDKTDSPYPFEILVIDNGSREENKAAIEREAEKLNQGVGCGKAFCGITYHCQPMIFNFSRMCNLGASLAKGELYLFLNDDMEIIQKNWLTLLADKAVLPYAGAVGAKLLYPDSHIIQHAGITNLRVGPAHKLQLLSDKEVHYYGKNRFVHDVMGVTGACLLVKKEVFEKAGGFAEELAVAFNDVDLCYTIYEMGYSNIVRNDVILYHHESLSRGKDGESEEKQLRLLREKDVLYERHQGLYGTDPFYHKYLTTDMLESEYTPACHYQVTLDMPWSAVTEEKELSSAVREDRCVVLGMECAMDIYKWKYGVSPGKGERKPEDEDMGYYFQGYSFIIGADNACYKKTLLLQNKENMRVLRIPPDERYRPDIKNNLKDQLNVDLTGFAAKVRLADIPKGTYRFGMLAEDQCSRQKLVNFSSWVLQAGENEYGL
ncbi:MAG: glycosyltransferase [Suilimivivens sp.]